MHSFQTPSPVRLRVEVPRGRIRVIAEDTDVTRVELTAIHGDDLAMAWIADAEVAQDRDEIIVRIRKSGMGWFGIGGAIEAAIHAPRDCAAILSVQAGSIETMGRLGDVDASSGSGSIRLDECREARARAGSGNIAIASSTGSVDARSGSGRIKVGAVGANARISTQSGDAELAQATGDARLSTASGNIDIGRAGDSLEAVAASGNVQIHSADHGRVVAKSASGQVSVGVARGAATFLDLSTMSGRVHSDLEPGAAPTEGERRLELTVSTMSGNVNVRRA